MALRNPKSPTARDESDRRHELLGRCRALLNTLNAQSPPDLASSKEFNWQYEAFQERIEVYTRLLAQAEGSTDQQDLRLQNAELAIDLSLEYFRDIAAAESHS